MSTIQHFRTLQQYEAWAAERVLKSIASARAYEPAAIRARGIFAHIQMARSMWLSRVGVTDKPVWHMFPDWSIERCAAEASAQDAAWHRYLASLHDADLQREIQYTSTESKHYISTVGEILTHVYNHATYHRGQIALLVVQAGGQSAATDFIACSRRALA
jgi:uncharacterized damage-inducible protein DinB